MAIAPIGLMSLPLLLLLSPVLTAPLSGPPFPLDPAMSAVAPAECIFYASSAGVAKADAGSPNQTEQLYAETEIVRLIEGLRAQFLASLIKTAGDDPGRQAIVAEMPKLVGALLHRPMATFVEDLKLSDEKLELRAGMVLDAGEQKGELEKSISKLVDVALEQGLPIGAMQTDGSTWFVMRMSMQTPEVRWGWHKDYFILAVGDDTANDIIERLDGGKTPAWLEQLRQDDSIERESSLCHFNIAALLDRLKPQMEREQVWSVVEKLGLTGLQAFDRRAGFDELGCAAHCKLTTAGQRRGLLEFIPDRPLSDNDLRRIPENAMIAAAVRFDLADAWKNLKRIGEEFDPRSIDRIDENIRTVEAKLGFHIEDDLLGSLDDIWTAYLPEGDLMSAWVGTALAVKVKDAPRLRVAIDALVSDARAKMPAGANGPQIVDDEFEGLKIYRLSGIPMPIAPSWCVTDDWFFAGLNPQTVRDLISSDDKSSLADVPAVDEAFGSRDAPTALLMVDSPKLTRAAYPFVQMGASMLVPQLKRQGIDIDPSILPSSNAIVPHLRPFVGTMTATSDGPQLRSQHSLPGGNGAIAALPLATLFGARASARPAVAATQELNNMKQIALAFHNYEAVNGKFPANLYDEDGNALLSWRVQLLPYMEQQALYEQFHLDEPWDSEHNKPLSKTVIKAFLAPGGPTDGRTCYLALAGEKTLFPGNEELSFVHVTDGTSNTIMFVKAVDQLAVPWSKPQDLDFDPESPFQGLNHPGNRFPIAMNDGSCRYIDLAIGEETMKALATRNGRETIPRGALSR